jgi:hypothetical protein
MVGTLRSAKFAGVGMPMLRASMDTLSRRLSAVRVTARGNSSAAAAAAVATTAAAAFAETVCRAGKQPKCQGQYNHHNSYIRAHGNISEVRLRVHAGAPARARRRKRRQMSRITHLNT